MDDTKKLALLEEMMELSAGSLKSDTVLGELEEWSSLNWLSFIVLVDDEFGRVVDGGTLAECSTVADLLRLMDANPA